MRSLLFLVAILFTSAPVLAALKVHEWGTFTSVQGSNGEAQFGLHHEEEALPSFVHNLDGILEAARALQPSSVAIPKFGRCQGCKDNCCMKGMCCEGLVTEQRLIQVTQKMETPVLYFYSDTPVKVDVTVDFPRGLISQYYPAPSKVLPLTYYGSGLQGGQIRYDKLEVLTEKVDVPPVLAGNVYAPARETASNYVRAGRESEKFIFYRGLGDFSTSLRVFSTVEKISLQDSFGRGIPYLLAVNIRDGKGAFRELGRLGANGMRDFSAPDLSKHLIPTLNMTEFEKAVGPKLVSALVKSGLYKDEAESMVNTWKLSYFHTEGFRILYVLPRGETDTVLPIQISPEPAELVRTLVGRVEILTKSEEEKLLALVTDAANRNDSKTLDFLGRFKDPKLRRVQQLTTDQKVLNFISANL